MRGKRVQRAASAFGHIGGRTAHKGAIGQGVSGFRVDVRSPDRLRAMFQRIDADPERFRASPPQPSHPPRAAADPGEDLIALYDRLLAP